MVKGPMTFYAFLMTLRNPDENTEMATFANAAFYDSAFPKQSVDHDEISDYLELEAGYVSSMTVFDDAWQLYLDKNA